jgi:L-ribulokinase
VLGKPVLVPDGIPTSLGSGIFALLAAGAYPSMEEAQARCCLPFKTLMPEARAQALYDQLFALYRRVYFAMGQKGADTAALGDVLPELRRIAAHQR